MNNVNTLDRMLRALLGVVFFELAFFWLAGGWQIAAYLVGAILVVTAAIRFCPLYRIIGISTVHGDAQGSGKAMVATAAVLLIVVVAGGSYASSFFTRKLFLEDFNAMNNYYKQTLKVVEAESNDAEIQSIRKNLDDLLGLAKEARSDQLPAKGEELKSSFVKVYLKRG